ncbi:MAG TPA: N-acetylmuramoyl-L-alanine amidase, partial [Candidatus Fimicola cottocaccae]|nr:N-acetylmuramoyl-L-alanine amidase [Candidatus Fimicola cottocaccae]
MNINKMLLSKNKYSRPGIYMDKIKGIVIHYVGNPNTSAEA